METRSYFERATTRSARVLVLAVALSIAYVFIGTVEPAATLTAYAQSDGYTFPETGKTVHRKFMDYWSAHGATARQGLPISEEMQERSDTNGRTYTVQYFEKAVFEMHPENQPPNDVLLSLLGVFRYKEKYPHGAPGQAANGATGSVLFPETGKHIGCAFLKYWSENGGLAQFGYPISEEFDELSDSGATYKVQYFQRAVFEYHMEAISPNYRETPATTAVESLGTLRLLQLGSVPLPAVIATPRSTGNGGGACEATAHGPSTSDTIEDAPVRSSVGKGFLLKGMVKSTKDCAPVHGASIIFWLAGPDGQYDDAHRAKVITDSKGAYTFESNYPAFYGAGGPHIHLYITADGYYGVETELFLDCNQTQGTFDPVLSPK